MKTRSDFVSNSSSSSFIIANDPVFNYFHITKKDVFEALVEIYGADKYKKYIEDEEKSVKEHPEWYKSLKWKVSGPFCIYDMTIKEDREEAIKRYGDLLKEWNATECKLDYKTGELQPKFGDFAFEEICEKIRDIYDINSFHDCKLDKNSTMFVRTQERQPSGSYGYNTKVPKYIVDFVNKTREFVGICDNLQVLKNELSRFFIHYQDNEIWSSQHGLPSRDDEDEEIWDIKDEDLAFRLGRGYFPNGGKDTKRKEIIKAGKKAISEHNKWSASRNKERDESIYESESYTKGRVFEVLFNKLVEMKKIKSNDQKFLKKFYRSTSRRDKDEEIKYNTRDGKTFSYGDLEDSCLTFVGHEG